MMVTASAVFYGWWDWRFCALIAGSIVGNWALATRLRPGKPQTHLSPTVVVRSAVALNLGVLGFFKYYGFFSLSLLQVFNSDSSASPIPLLDVVLPVGISFFTFQALSYVIDVSRRDVEPVSLLDVAVYLSFFPQLVAGPIVRASEFFPQLGEQERPDTVPATEAIWLIGRGLFKKVVISTYLAEAIVDPAFAGTTTASRGELWMAMYGYAIQIYADFSGYTDIAIGVALLLGFRFPQNFDNPYRSTSLQEFWRRWHQTLSRWLRDYLYIPLGGSRHGRLRTYRNLALTMVLGGLWHGAAWTFVIWGAIHATVLAGERLVGEWRQTEPTDLKQAQLLHVARWIVTFHIVCLAWIFFRAESLDHALDFLQGMLSARSGPPIPTAVLVIVVASLGFQFIPRHFGHKVRKRLSILHPSLQAGLLGVWIALVVALGPQGVAPFIYFQF